MLGALGVDGLANLTHGLSIGDLHAHASAPPRLRLAFLLPLARSSCEP